MPPSKDLHKTWLVSLTEGKKLGEIKDVYLDAALTTLTGVFVGREGLINRKTFLAPLSVVAVRGLDAWLVNDNNAVMEQTAVPEAAAWVLVSDLRGREIQTDGGAKLASIEDVILDKSGRVLGFELSRIQVKGKLAETKVIARGAIHAVGSKDEPMLATLEKAENMPLVVL